MKKNLPNRNKVYSDFLTGTAIAWFSGGVIAPFLSKFFTNDNFILGIYSIIVAYMSLRFAIILREEDKDGY